MQSSPNPRQSQTLRGGAPLRRSNPIKTPTRLSRIIASSFTRRSLVRRRGFIASSPLRPLQPSSIKHQASFRSSRYSPRSARSTRGAEALRFQPFNPSTLSTLLLIEMHIPDIFPHRFAEEEAHVFAFSDGPAQEAGGYLHLRGFCDADVCLGDQFLQGGVQRTRI